LPERRAEKSQGSRTVGGTVAAGMNGSDFLNTASMGSGNPTGAFGLGLMGASSVADWSV
jgi:hypothetical protein